MLNKKHEGLIRKQKYDIGYILEKVQFKSKLEGKKSKINLDGDLINMASDRLKCFSKNGVVCCTCGLKGSFFAKEKHKGDISYHLNLYGIDSRGDEVLITKDHIIPKCAGGKDSLENYNTMCMVCNSYKKDNMPVFIVCASVFNEDGIMEDKHIIKVFYSSVLANKLRNDLHDKFKSYHNIPKNEREVIINEFKLINKQLIDMVSHHSMDKAYTFSIIKSELSKENL